MLVTTLAIFSDINVDVDLYAMVFGESVLNDAVSIVLASTIDKYSVANEDGQFTTREFFRSCGIFFGVFIGAFTIGCSMGCLNALLTKFTKIRQHSDLETALFVLISYLTFFISEAAGFSGKIK